MKIIGKAIKIIKNGGVIICPTDTIYGLICDATNKKAVEKFLKSKKGRNQNPCRFLLKTSKWRKNWPRLIKIRRNF